MLFAKEVITVIGGLMGGIYGFIIARMAAAKIATKNTYQPVILKINLPIYPMNFELRQGGQGDRPMSVDILRDSGKHPQPTPP
ncbi:hypothetical protein [Candidatus Regiella insecticola]|uniref:hypothetical protein n=1 Tax=Candidatus Regiella insecticola TaxID=138073 RepID=UPI00030668CA|nr:hypothetical protein [Candidatus Regiella insecticola]